MDLSVLRSLFLQVANVFLYKRAHTIMKSAMLHCQVTDARSREAHKWPLRLTNRGYLFVRVRRSKRKYTASCNRQQQQPGSEGRQFYRHTEQHSKAQRSAAQHSTTWHRNQEYSITCHDPHLTHGFKLLSHTHIQLPSSKDTPKTTTCAHLPHGTQHMLVRQTMDTGFLTPMKSKESCLLELRARPSRSVLGPGAVGLLPWGPVPLRKSDKPELRAELSCDWPPVQQPVHTLRQHASITRASC